MKKIFLLDAYALIYRAYYAFISAPRINSKGRNTSAIMGFVNTLEEVIRKEKPDYLAVAFDPSGPTFRHEAYPAYKAQREATPEDIKLSVPVIKQIIQAYRIPILEVSGYEADDVIGTVARQAAAAGLDAYMMTPDKDYAQLVAPHITMCRPARGGGALEKLGPEEVKAKYSLESPEQVIDLLGLMGDTADNIPGCPGVGEKTAVKLIGQFGSIEQLLSRTDELKGAMKRKVEENAEQIRFSRFLATIKTDVPITADFEQMKLTTPDVKQLQEIFEELEFRTLLDRVLKNHGLVQKQEPVMGNLFGTEPSADQESENETALENLKTVPHEYHLVEREEDIQKLCDKLLTTEEFCLDTETTGLDVMTARLVGLSFACREFEAYYVPIPSEREEALKILQILKPAYENSKILKIGQNIKYDLNMLAAYGIRLSGPMFDTMLAHYVLQPELRHNMDYLAEIYLHYQTIHIEELIGPKGRKQKNMADLAPAQVYEYACEDADVTLRLKRVLADEVEKAGAHSLLYDIEMPLMPVLAHMERNGVCLNTDTLAETERHFTQRMQQLEDEIFSLSGHPFMLTSPRQVGEVLFDELKITEKAKKTKTGQYVTSEEVLESLRQNHPIVEKILAHRGLKKLLSTYIEALPKLINPDTGHIHTSFNQAVTATGRLSSSNPNLQNIPVRMELGRLIRKAFVPKPGCVFLDADYSQIELRVLAHMSGDENLIEAYREAEDIHRMTASKVFHVPLEEVTPLQRRNAKAVNFGIVYGISSFGLGQDLGISRKEAEAYIQQYFETYPGIHEFLNRCVEDAKEKGYSVTMFGRRRPMPELKSSNFMQRSFGERVAMNAPIQGTAADIIKIAMIRVAKRLKEEQLKTRLLLQVHDELLLEVPEDELEKAEKILEEEMTGAAHLAVKLEIDMHTGNNWYEAK